MVMSYEALIPLALFAVVSTFSPGGATTLATASGANFGFRRTLPLIAGVAMGLASMGAAAAVGLDSVLLAMPALQLALKALGSIYLLWLAWQLGHRGATHTSVGVGRPSSFVAGMWMLWHNPKAWAMTVGAAASFAALADGPARLGALLFVAFGISATVSLSLWCAAGLMLARLLRGDRQWRIVNAGLAFLLALSVATIWL
jgi:threonine/homoserine/homoserine lactone efflux protein